MMTPEVQAEILRLHHVERLSLRELSERFKAHRRTVTALIERDQVLLQRPSNSNPRPKILDPHHVQIDALLRDCPDRSAVNILQRLKDSGYLGGLTVLRDHLRSRRAKDAPQAYLSLEFLPGQAAQVDWGDFGDPFGLGRKLWCFVMVLCHSRQLYVEFTLSACLESFLRCHEHAFNFFGGITKEIWYDNLASAVTERMGRLVRFNHRFLAYVGHCRFKPVACNLNSGHEKGRVEDGVRYVRHNFWPGRTFTDLDDVNAQKFVWLDRFANKRTHASTHKIPELHFEQEKPCLLPLPEPYDTDEKRTVVAGKQFRVRFDSNEYSVPWRLVGRAMTLRADEKTVRLYLGSKRIYCHKRSWRKGQSIIDPKHQEGLLEQKPGAQTTSDIQAVKSLGENAKRYVEFLGAQHGSLEREFKSLMVLITVYGPQALEACIGRALLAGIIGADHLERLLIQSVEPADTKPAPMSLTDPRLQIVPHIPNLKSYDTLLFDTEPKPDEDKNEGS
jgi:transposase